MLPRSWRLSKVGRSADLKSALGETKRRRGLQTGAPPDFIEALGA